MVKYISLVVRPETNAKFQRLQTIEQARIGRNITQDEFVDALLDTYSSAQETAGEEAT